LFDEPATLAGLVIGGVLSAALALVYRRRFRRSGILCFFTCWAFSMVLVGMFIAGGRPLELRGIDFRRLQSCEVGNTGLMDLQSIGNVGMYMPLSFFLVLLTKNTWLSLAASLVVVGSLEFIQSVTDFGVCELADVVHNVIGVCLGVTCGVFASVAWRRLRETAG
jgi:hypothetical protein